MYCPTAVQSLARVSAGVHETPANVPFGGGAHTRMQEMCGELLGAATTAAWAPPLVASSTVVHKIAALVTLDTQFLRLILAPLDPSFAADTTPAGWAVRKIFSDLGCSERLRGMPTTSANTATKAIGAVLALGVAVLLAFTPMASAHSTTRRCGSVSSPTHGHAGGVAVNNIRAVNVSCKIARSVALNWCDHRNLHRWHVSKHPAAGDVLLTKGNEKVYGEVAG